MECRTLSLSSLIPPLGPFCKAPFKPLASEMFVTSQLYSSYKQLKESASVMLFFFFSELVPKSFNSLLTRRRLRRLR